MNLSTDLIKKESPSFAIEKITYIEPASMPEMHYHDHYEILYVTESERFLSIGGAEYKLTKDRIALIPPYIPHLTRSGDKSPEERILVNFKSDFLSGAKGLLHIDLLQVFDAKNPIVELNGLSEECKILLLSLLKTQRDEGRTKLKLLELLLTLCEKRTSLAIDEEFFEILKFIENNFNKKLTLELISKKFYINKFTVLRKIKKYTGMGLPKYINTIRIINAKKALMKTDKIIDVALFSGFGSVSSLDRIFVEEVGMTPREYRKMMLSKASK